MKRWIDRAIDAHSELWRRPMSQIQACEAVRKIQENLQLAQDFEKARARILSRRRSRPAEYA